MPDNHSFSQNLQAVLQAIDDARLAAGRQGPVHLLAVSKTQSAEAVRALAACGQRDFGENYVQEGLAKMAALADLPLRWHLIGPLQSNKCAEVARHFDWLQTLDRAKLVPLLERARPDDKPPLNVLIQVNIDAEASKSGCTPEAVPDLAARVVGCSRLRLRGLMAIPRPETEPGLRRDSFRRLHDLFAGLRDRLPGIDTLSMGMSDDFPLAIAEGASLVRLGTDLFGRRNP